MPSLFTAEFVLVDVKLCIRFTPTGDFPPILTPGLSQVRGPPLHPLTVKSRTSIINPIRLTLIKRYRIEFVLSYSLFYSKQFAISLIKSAIKSAYLAYRKTLRKSEIILVYLAILRVTEIL